MDDSFYTFYIYDSITTLLLISFGLDPRTGKTMPSNRNNGNNGDKKVRRIGTRVGDEIADNLYDKYIDADNDMIEIDSLDINQRYPNNPFKKNNNKSKNHMLGGCEGTRYGCCPDGITASSQDGSNCNGSSKNNMLGGCEGTRYGCCPDGITASSQDGSNCKTGSKNNMLGGCEGTRYGCCPDGITASSQDGSNCEGSDYPYKGKDVALEVQKAGIKESNKMYREEQKRRL